MREGAGAGEGSAGEAGPQQHRAPREQGGKGGTSRGSKGAGPLALGAPAPGTHFLSGDCLPYSAQGPTWPGPLGRPHRSHRGAGESLRVDR